MEAANPRAVRIYRRNREWVIDAGGRTIPYMRNLSPYLPQSAKSGISASGWGYVIDALAGGMSPQILSSAIAAYFVEHPNVNGAITMEEGVAELPDNTAYFAHGDYIYKMIPVRQASSSKAVRLMREKVRVEIERVREGLKAQASQEAQAIIHQAELKASQIRAEAERLRQVDAESIKFPPFLRGYGLKWGSPEAKYVMQYVNIEILSISYNERTWPTVPSPDTGRIVTVALWLPLNANPESVHMADTSRGYLPHIMDGSACMKIGDKLSPIDSAATLLRFTSQVSRAMSVINLASLLAADIHTWMPEVVKLLPPEIKTWLEGHMDRSTQRGILELPPSATIERSEETWTTR